MSCAHHYYANEFHTGVRLSGSEGSKQQALSISITTGRYFA